MLATGSEPRHVRFALRLQQEFGNDVVAWYRTSSSAKSSGGKDGTKPAAASAASPNFLSRAKGLAKRIVAAPPAELAANARPARSMGADAPSIFVTEVEQLQQYRLIEPTDLPPQDVNAFLVSELTRLKPFFFLTLGGGLYSGDVLRCVRGIAINQHAGHSPEYKGNQTTFQALYHRDLSCVASTVHVTTTGADAGPMLRRSQPCLAVQDTPYAVAERVVALGTELMIECVHEIRDTGSILAFDQPPTGTTYLSRDFNDFVRERVTADFSSGWLPGALKQRQLW